MAQHVEVRLVDDITGDEAHQTVEFGIDGKEYVIDLSDDNAAALRDVLAAYVASARAISGPKRRPARKPANHDGTDISAIRAWARQNGFQVKDKGRIPGNILEAYAHREKVETHPEDATPDASSVTQGEQTDEHGWSEDAPAVVDTSNESIKDWWEQQGNKRPKTVTPTIRRKFTEAHQAA